MHNEIPFVEFAFYLYEVEPIACIKAVLALFVSNNLKKIFVLRSLQTSGLGYESYGIKMKVVQDEM